MISEFISQFADLVCGYPLFILLIGGGAFLFCYSGAISLRHFHDGIMALVKRSSNDGKGQISPFQALMSEISSTVGMGNIAGVAVALTMGGAGAIFWMWVSAVVGMATKFFEGTLAVMYKGKDNRGEVQGGPMYVMMATLGRYGRPMALFFACFALIGTLCFMQANQLVEAFTTVVTDPLGIENTLTLRFVMGTVICALVGFVILGGIERISKIASKIVPMMVSLYFILVLIICILHFADLPAAFASIFRQAFSLEAGVGGLVGTAVIGARRAAYINEAGVGTASLMHGASRNPYPVKEGLVAMLGPAIDSGLVCTLTALPILLSGDYLHSEGIKGVHIALSSFGKLLPGCGEVLLLVIVMFFAFSTMFSYSYYGLKCTNFLFGAQNTRYYNYFYLAMIIVAAMVPLSTAVSVMDISFAFMALPNMIMLLVLAPRVKRAATEYFASRKPTAGKE